MSHTTALSPAVFTTFGDLLRFLRRRARLQQRDLAIAVGYSESQICRLEQNQRLPDVTTLLARFVPALDLDEQPELATRLLELAAAARGEQLDGLGISASQTSWPPIINDPPAPPARPATPGNLPAPLTALIDRTEEVAAVQACLGRSDVRLLTLIGPPGIGKTRLTLHIADMVAHQFADGVFFVALAPIRDPDQVLPAIAHTLGVEKRGAQPVVEALRAALREKQQLLLLDNFEHLLAAAPQIAELLRLAPALKVLVTSRAALHLSGEHLFAVPPLELPDPRALPPLDQLAGYPAVALFTARVRAIKRDFALTAENARAVVEICACLDGLPLALELAAARSRLFSPQALLDRLRSASGPTALQFLVGGPRDLLAHQQTLRGAIDWSYDLLDADERRLLMALSVFVGGCTVSAAEAVCAELKIENEELKNERAHTACSILNSQFSILDGLLSLVDKSLLKYEPGAGAEPRFSMLETIREYAREKLEAAGQVDAARRCHAAHYLALALAAEHELSGAQQERWFQQLGAEYNNLWVALEWFAAADAETGLRLAASLRQFWLARGCLNEGRSWLESLLARAGGAAADVRARALCAAGYLAFHQGDLLKAAMLSEESLALAHGLGDRRGVAEASYNLAGIALMHNEYPRAAALFGECLALYRALDARAEVALVLKNLGLIAKDQGDFARATAFYDESLALRRALGDQRGIAQSLFNLGVVAYWQARFGRAYELTEQSAACYRELDDKMGAAYAIETLGMAAHKLGHHAEALRLLDESLRLFRELGDQFGIALLLADMGGVSQAQGGGARAVRLYTEGLALSWKIGDKRRAAFCLEGLASAVGAARPSAAATLLGAAEALREAIGAPLPPSERDDYDRSVAAMRGSSSDAAAFAGAWSAGRQLPIERAVAYAISMASW